jgi:hypothetical protein
MYILMCILCLVGVSKATPCVLWRERYDPQGGDFGALQRWHAVLTGEFVGDGGYMDGQGGGGLGSPCR